MGSLHGICIVTSGSLATRSPAGPIATALEGLQPLTPRPCCQGRPCLAAEGLHGAGRENAAPTHLLVSKSLSGNICSDQPAGGAAGPGNGTSAQDWEHQSSLGLCGVGCFEQGHVSSVPLCSPCVVERRPFIVPSRKPGYITDLLFLL